MFRVLIPVTLTDFQMPVTLTDNVYDLMPVTLTDNFNVYGLTLAI